MTPRRLGKDARIVIVGAGSIGCFIGGLLVAGAGEASNFSDGRVIEKRAGHFHRGTSG